MRRTVRAETTQAASTAAVIGKLPVVSSARNPIVSGPPTMATATPLMPTSAHTTAGSAWAAEMCANTPANSLPSTEPRNKEAKNRPPRNPEPIDTADAIAFRTNSMARYVSGLGLSNPLASAA